MCDTCGCQERAAVGAAGKTIDVFESLLARNDEIADRNRKHVEAMGAVGINLIGGPGSGKTLLLERTVETLGHRYGIAVLEGDIETDLDCQRIRSKGVPVVQLTTGGACHLDAALVHRGLHEMEKLLGGDGLDLLFIENVGNLVCPASFYLGEHRRVVMVSIPEGPDKPAKYPAAFRTSHLFVISKVDLLPHFDFSIETARAEALEHNPDLQIMELSSVTGEGFDSWEEFLASSFSRYAPRAQSG